MDLIIFLGGEMKKIFVLALLMLSSIMILAQTNGVNTTIIELTDGTILIKLETEDGNIIKKYFCFGDDEYGYEYGDFLYSDGSINQGPSSDDIVLDATIWMQDDESGVLPQDVCYNSVNNKYYLYGSRRLVVFDGEDNSRITTINTGQTGTILDIDHWSLGSEHKLAYNPINNKIYCATDSGQLFIIDGSTDEVLTIHTASEILNLAITSVIYNEATNRIYWSLNDWITYRKIKAFDGLSNEFLMEYNTTSGIYDLVCNPSGDKIFLSLSWGVRVLNTNDFSQIAYIWQPRQASAITYNPISNKVYVGSHENYSVAVIDGINNTFIDYIDVPYEHITLMTYNPVDNKIYCTGYDTDNLAYGLIIIDGNNDEVITTYVLGHAISLAYNPSDNHILCGGNDAIIIIDGTSNLILGDVNNSGGKSFRLAYNSVENTIISANLNEGTATVFNNNCNLITLNQIGGGVISGCYNYTNNKIYFIQYCSQNENSFLNVIDGETNQIINILNVGSRLRSCVYNYEYNKIYVSDSENDVVIVIDGQSDEVITTIPIPTNTKTARLYECPNNKIYGTGWGGIHIIDAATDQIISTLNTSSTTIYFAYNPENHKVYIFKASPDRVLVIDANDNTIITEIDIGGQTSSITYNSNNNKIYCTNRSSDTVIIIDGATDAIISTIYNIDAHTVTYNSTLNKLYLLLGSGGVIVIDGEQDEIIAEINLEGINRSLLFNPQDNRIYIHNLAANNLEMYISVIDCNNDEVYSNISLEQKQLPLIFEGVIIENSLVYNSANNKIYAGNFGFSNVSVIQCDATEIKTYTFPRQGIIPDCGWKWLSFDILYSEQDDNEAINFLAPISDIDELDKAWFKPHSPNSSELYISFHPTQQNLDHLFTSPYGYKFHTWNACSFTVTGVRCPEDTTFPLYGENQGNWIGYFLEETQHIYDAFGGFTGYLDNFTGIRTQHWAIKKENGGWPRVPYTISPGDMVIVYCTEDVPLFTWNFVESREKYIVPESQDFTFEEEADYIPVFISLDPEDLPSEIGAYVDGECKGATVVQDTSSQLCAYILENQGQNLEFEFSYGGREQNKRIKEYGIYDPETSQTEKGTIQIDNSRDCYYVSFRGGSNNIPTPIKLETSNYPNPFNPETKISFSIPEEQNIELSVYNLKGQKVKQLVNGQFPTGQHSVVWEGKDDNGKPVGSGLYFYKLKIQNKVLTKKMLLLK